MTFKEDNITRIKREFGEKANEAIEVLNEAIEKTDYLKTDRIIRCIVFLSKGNLAYLHESIKAATSDTRDVMLWAEYENLNDDSTPKRIRDFNKTFEKCTDKVKE